MDEALEDILKVIFDQVTGKPPNHLFNAIFPDGFVTLKSRHWREKLLSIILPLDGGGLRWERL